MNSGHLKKYMRLKAFDTSTEEGRADERYRLALFTISANFVSRAAAMLVMVLTVSLTVPYLGTELFGVWMTIASMAGALAFLDLGIGNALTNRVAEAASKKDHLLLADTISGGLGVLLLLALCMGLVLFFLATVMPWERLIKAGGTSQQAEIRATAKMFAILFAASLFTTGIQRVFYGLQRGFEAHFAAIGGSVASLVALYWCAVNKAQIPFLLLSTMGGAILANLLLFIILVKRRQINLLHIQMKIKLEAPHLLKVGGLFFLLQIGTMVGWGADNLIISSTMGAATVAVFNVTQRLFQFVSQPLAVINAPLWPAFADSNYHGDKEFLRRTLCKSLLLSGSFSIIFGSILFAFHGPIIEKWTSGLVKVSFSLALIFAVWTLFDVLGYAFAMFMNGCNLIKPQIPGLITLIIFGLPLKLGLIKRFGLEAMLAGFALFFLLNIAFWYGGVFRKQIAKALI